MRMPPEGTESIHNAPPKGTESMQNASLYNIESHQSLYLKKIFTQKAGENWEGFNSWIKNWQSQRGYKKLNNKVHNKRPIKNSKIPKDSLRAKWLKKNLKKWAWKTKNK